MQERLLENPEEEYSIFCSNIENSKLVNDTLRHEAGNQMLSAFADVLRSQTRPADIRCRYGGDEFLLVLRHMVRPEDTVDKCADICQAFQNFFTMKDFPSSCSSGVIMYTGYAESFGEQIAQADRALYRAKRENRGGCCLWNAEKDL